MRKSTPAVWFDGETDRDGRFFLLPSLVLRAGLIPDSTVFIARSGSTKLVSIEEEEKSRKVVVAKPPANNEK
jgi:hypothetical protein